MPRTSLGNVASSKHAGVGRAFVGGSRAASGGTRSSCPMAPSHVRACRDGPHWSPNLGRPCRTKARSAINFEVLGEHFERSPTSPIRLSECGREPTAQVGQLILRRYQSCLDFQRYASKAPVATASSLEAIASSASASAPGPDFRVLGATRDSQGLRLLGRPSRATRLRHAGHSGAAGASGVQPHLSRAVGRSGASANRTHLQRPATSLVAHGRQTSADVTHARTRPELGPRRAGQAPCCCAVCAG